MNNLHVRLISSFERQTNYCSINAVDRAINIYYFSKLKVIVPRWFRTNRTIILIPLTRYKKERNAGIIESDF